MQSREDVSRAEADSDPASDGARSTQQLPTSGSDWSIDADPLNPEWRSKSAGARARQRIAARRAPRLPTRADQLVPWLQHGGWRWLALAAGLLVVLLIALALRGLGSSPALVDAPAAPDAGAASVDTLPVRPTVTAASVPTSPAPPPAFSVANTAGQGLFLRPEPNGNNDPVKLLAEGTRLEALGEEVQGADYVWIKVRDPEGAEGWVARDFVAPAE